MPDDYKPDMGESSPKSEDSPVITHIETNIFEIGRASCRERV